MSLTDSADIPGDSEVFEELDTYPWDSDKEFQSGLAAILGPNPSSNQAGDLTIRAKCFYYARKKGYSVDFDAYKAHIEKRSPNVPLSTHSLAGTGVTSSPITPMDNESQSSATISSYSSSEPQYPVPFASIVALITSGAPIPGVKEIPTTVLSSHATKSNASKRRKPWETDAEVSEDDNNSRGTFGDRRDEMIVQDLGTADSAVS